MTTHSDQRQADALEQIADTLKQLLSHLQQVLPLPKPSKVKLIEGPKDKDDA